MKLVKSILVLSLLVSVLGVFFHERSNDVNPETVSTDTYSVPFIGNSKLIPEDTGQNISVGLPVRLKIASLNIDTKIESVGLTSKGIMDTSKNPANASWYKLGPRPGEIGDSVIGGHFGWVDKKPAVFDNLKRLQTGDKLNIEDENGSILTFVVRTKQLYSSTANNTAEIFSSDDGKSHLNLVTCDGVWDKVNKSYSQRLVIFTDLV